MAKKCEVKRLIDIKVASGYFLCIVPFGHGSIFSNYWKADPIDVLYRLFCVHDEYLKSNIHNKIRNFLVENDKKDSCTLQDTHFLNQNVFLSN